MRFALVILVVVFLPGIVLAQAPDGVFLEEWVSISLS